MKFLSGWGNRLPSGSSTQRPFHLTLFMKGEKSVAPLHQQEVNMSVSVRYGRPYRLSLGFEGFAIRVIGMSYIIVGEEFVNYCHIPFVEDLIRSPLDIGANRCLVTACILCQCWRRQSGYQH